MAANISCYSECTQIHTHIHTHTCNSAVSTWLPQLRFNSLSSFHEPICTEHQQHHVSDLICFSWSSPSAVYTYESQTTMSIRWIRLLMFSEMLPSAVTQHPPTRLPKFICCPPPPPSHILFLLAHLDKLGNYNMTPIIKVSRGTSCPFESSASLLPPAVDLPSFLPSRDLCCHQTYAVCVICVISQAYNQMPPRERSLVLIANCICCDAGTWRKNLNLKAPLRCGSPLFSGSFFLFFFFLSLFNFFFLFFFKSNDPFVCLKLSVPTVTLTFFFNNANCRQFNIQFL